MKRAFLKYFAKVFKKQSIDVGKGGKYIKELDLPKVPEGLKKILNESITKEEIVKVIEAMKLGMALGPDGFLAKFYKILKKNLIPCFEIAFNKILKTSKTPMSWKGATFSLIPKQQQDLTNVKNYSQYHC